MQNRNSLTRRLFIKQGSTAVAASALLTQLGSRVASAAAGGGTSSSVRSVGEMQLTVLSDGRLRIPLSFTVGRDRALQIAPDLESRGLPSVTAEPDVNIAVIRAGEELIVVDGGAGPNFVDSAGLLIDALDEAEIDPGDVTKVVCTHAHPDHLWGLYDDFEEAPLFYNAEHFIHDVERTTWLDEGLLTRVPQAQVPFAVAAQRLLPLFDWTVLTGDETEIVGGLTAVRTAGHTPGHLSLQMNSGSDSLLISSDVFNHPYISFAHPDWANGADGDGVMGAATRLAVMDRLASEQMPSLVYHLPYPGVIQVTRGLGGMPFDYQLV